MSPVTCRFIAAGKAAIAGVFSGALLVTLLLAGSGRYCQAAETPVSALPQSEIIRLGERMYREGILPSGKVMGAFIRGDVEVDSTAFSCSSCHLRSGLGSVEGGVITPPTTGSKLYQSYHRPPSLDDIPDRAGRYIYAKTVQKRPAYTRETLATAMRFGTDPAGQIFNDVMPRYPLSDRDMSILINYLELLSAAPSPGASSTEFRFATIISDDVSKEDRQAMLLPLQQFIAQKNQQLALFNDFKKFGFTPTADMKYAFRQVTLDVWELRGAPETWPAQLQALYEKRPVFALLGGISNREWQPIHDFCEAQRLPCLFPLTNLPVTTNPGWYTFYFNKGYAQEGEAVAHYLHRLEQLTADTRILQIEEDSPAGRGLAGGFQSFWSEQQRSAVTTIKLSASQLGEAEVLARLIDRHKPDVLLLWAGASAVHNLPPLLAGKNGPAMVFASATYLGKQAASLPETIRDRVYLSYPFRLTPYVGPKTGGYDSREPIQTTFRDFGDQRIGSRTLDVLQQSVQRGLSLLYDNLYRDNLLDIMSMQMDLIVRDYERLSFGPGQRYASKGCYIIQLGAGAEPAIIPRSEWIIH